MAFPRFSQALLGVFRRPLFNPTTLHVRRLSSSSTTESNHSATSNSLLDRIKGLTPIDVEKELFREKRNMGAFYAKGYYQDALLCASDMEAAIEMLMGRQTTMYASALNNVALMNKMLGNLSQAVDKYTLSLQIYGEVVGKSHGSYASTLSNLGILYRTQAETSKGMDRQELLQRAEEALGDALALRLQLHGPEHRDTITSQNNLASVYRLTGRQKQAEESLQQSLATCRQAYGADALTAQTLNALGILCKSQKRLDESREFYAEALQIRSNTVGEAHPDAIVSKHNLAELLLEIGGTDNEAQARALQEEILAVTEKIGAKAASKVAATIAAAPAPVAVKKLTAAQEPPPYTYATRKRRK